MVRNSAKLERTSKTFNQEPTELLRHCILKSKIVRRLTNERYELLDHVEYKRDGSVVSTQWLYITETHLVAQQEGGRDYKDSIDGLATIATLISSGWLILVVSLGIPNSLSLLSLFGILFSGFLVFASRFTSREFRQPFAELPTEILLEIEDLLHRDKEITGEESLRAFASARTLEDHKDHLANLKRNLISGLQPGIVEIRAEILLTHLERSLSSFERLAEVSEALRYFEDFAYLRFPHVLRDYRAIGRNPSLQQSTSMIEEINELLDEIREFDSILDNPKLLRLFVYSLNVDKVLRPVSQQGGAQ